MELTQGKINDLLSAVEKEWKDVRTLSDLESYWNHCIAPISDNEAMNWIKFWHSTFPAIVAQSDFKAIDDDPTDIAVDSEGNILYMEEQNGTVNIIWNN